jgi:hypothetical protein
MPSQTQDGPTSATVVQRHVEKILRSDEFSGTEVLRNLLSFLTKHYLEKPGEVVKEYEVATAVLGRAEGFDPRVDSAVRVHTGRLRAKLAEYYMSDGVDDPIVIEVPKGSYQISWRYRTHDAARLSAATPAPAVPGLTKPLVWNWKAFALGVATAAVLAGIAVGGWIAARPKRIPATVEAFWQPFFQSPQPPIIVFSNHRFTGSSATGLHYFREGIDSPAESNDTYSGTGTVMAVGELSSLFSLNGRSARLKRAELLTWDEARDANVVFVGAPEANSRLREMAPLQYFRFKSSYEGPQFGTGAIVNLNPGSDEKPMYFGSDRPFTFDYAVIALLPNVNPERKVLILAGTNTYGCQAAAEFVMRADLLQEFYSRLRVRKGGNLPDFEALIKVGISGGVPVQPRLLAMRVHKSGS